MIKFHGKMIRTLKRLNERIRPLQMAAFRTVLIDPLPGEEENVHLAARLLAGTVVQPGKYSPKYHHWALLKAEGLRKVPFISVPNLVKTLGVVFEKLHLLSIMLLFSAI